MKPNPPAAPLANARRVLALLLAVNLFNYIDRYVLASVVGSVKDTFLHQGGASGGAIQAIQDWTQAHLHFKPELAFMGFLSMAFMTVYMVGAPIFGHLADRYPRRVLIGIGVILWTLASGASGLAPTFLALLLTRCFIGIGEAAYGPVAPAIISDLYPVEHRGRALAWFNLAIPVGSALGFALGGSVLALQVGDWGARYLGIHAADWRWAFFLVVPPGLILGAFCFFLREPERGQSDNTGKFKAAAWSDYLALLRNPSFALCTLGMAAMTFSIGGIAFWMPYYLAQLPGAPELGKVSIIFGGIVCLAGMSGTLIGGYVGDRLRGRFRGSYFIVSGIAMIIGFPLMWWMLHASFPGNTIWVLTFCTCFCLFFNTGPTNTILANVTHPSIRAVAFAANIFFIHAFGDVISPVVIGVLGDRYGMMDAFLVVGVMFLLAGGFWLWGARHLDRDTLHHWQ
ncbi:MAG TPA: MFS transporter [Opitutales bacterium]|nr:MFS transporter [Opitutales bacterium]